MYAAFMATCFSQRQHYHTTVTVIVTAIELMICLSR